jgi:C-terminal processing protease CtpA/Prc
MRRTTPLRWLVLFAALVMLAAAPSLAAARAWLGVYTQEVTDELRDALDLKDNGVLVNQVVSDSPADRAGLRKGDVILSVDGHSVDSPSALSDLIGDADEGQPVSIALVRKGDHLTLSVRLASRPESDDDDEGVAPAPPAPPVPPVPPSPHAAPAPKAPRGEMRWYSSDDNDGVDPKEIRDRVREVIPNFDFDSNDGRGFMINTGRGRLGVRIETLGDDLASALGSSGTKGVLVLEVIKDTPADKAGLRAGDIITAVDRTSVYDTDDLVKALRGESGKVSLSVTRRGEKRTVEAALEDSPRVMRLRSGDGPMGMGRMGDGKKFEVRVDGDADRDDLRKQLDELRQQLRELRQQLEERRR